MRVSKLEAFFKWWAAGVMAMFFFLWMSRGLGYPREIVTDVIMQVHKKGKCSAAEVVQGRDGFVSYCDVDDVRVTYDGTSLMINGERSLFLSGSVHGPRGTPEVWDDVLSKAVEFGSNAVEIYVMWNYHEPTRGAKNYTELGLLLDACAAHGLFVNLRIGPYVCAEWDYGGIPAWVGLEYPDIQFRTSDDAWLAVMRQYATDVVTYCYDWFAGRGGPIILAQIENELTSDPEYVQWCGDLANGLEDSIPWIMCNGDSANNTINTCNGYGDDCPSFLEKNGQNGRVLVDQPALWTENEQGFQIWGETKANPVEYFWGSTAAQVAYQTLRWFARGGTHNNYYMFFGGSNHGPFAGAGITNAYAYDAPLCPNAAKHQPKFDHLANMHFALQSVAPKLFQTPANLSLDGGQAFVFDDVAFVEAVDDVLYRGVRVPAGTASLFDGSALLFNSAAVGNASKYERHDVVVVQDLDWVHALEDLRAPGARGLVEQSALTLGSPTQYAVYATTLIEPGALIIESDYSNGYVAFVDGEYQGAVDDHSHNNGPLNYTLHISKPGRLVLLSESFGFNNGMGAGTGPKKKGIVGSVFLNDKKLPDDSWTSRAGLAGIQAGRPVAVATAPATWSQAVFPTPQDLPTNADSGQGLLLDANGLGRGHFFINGIDAGRFWNIKRGDTTTPTQRFYHIPLDWLRAPGNDNTLLVFDALGSSNISAVRLLATTIARSSIPNMPDVVDSSLSCLI